MDGSPGDLARSPTPPSLLPSGLVVDDGSELYPALHPPTEVNPSRDKVWWRRQARARRSGLPFDHEAFCRTLTRFLDAEVDRQKRVVVYLAMTDEVDLAPVVAGSPDPTARFAVTRTPAEGFDLTVHPWGCEMEQHPYGYAQPVRDAPRIEMADIGAFLVPGLAFDRHGTRLGRGKGYYDRLLARAPDAMRVAVTGDYLVDQLPCDNFDVAMTHLAFSTGVVPVPVAWIGPGGS